MYNARMADLALETATRQMHSFFATFAFGSVFVTILQCTICDQTLIGLITPREPLINSVKTILVSNLGSAGNSAYVNLSIECIAI